MQKYETVSKLSLTEFKRLTGVKKDTFMEMISIVTEAENKRMSRGGKPPYLGVEDRLLMTLEYLREYRTYFHLGQSYGLSERHTLKTQLVVDKKSSLIICTNFCNGKKHDFKLFKDSKVRWIQKIRGIVDSGYIGIKKLQNSSLLPKKRSRGKLLTKDEKLDVPLFSALIERARQTQIGPADAGHSRRRYFLHRPGRFAKAAAVL